MDLQISFEIIFRNYIIICSSHFLFLVFGHVWWRSYENTTILRNVCLHFARQDGQDRKKITQLKWSKYQKPKDKKWDERNMKNKKNVYKLFCFSTVLWQWQDDKGNWHTYGYNDCRVIEAAHVAGKTWYFFNKIVLSYWEKKKILKISAKSWFSVKGQNKFLVTECFFNLLLGVSHILWIRTIRNEIGI